MVGAYYRHNLSTSGIFQDAMFVRELVMEGEWDNLLEYLNPMRENKEYNSMRLMIERQRYPLQ